MKLIIATILLLFAGYASAQAELVAYSADKTQAVVLHSTPCDSKESLRRIKPEYHKMFEFAASYHGYASKPVIKGCYWIMHEGSDVLVITVWEDGDSFPLNPTQFIPLQGPLQLRAKGTSL